MDKATGHQHLASVREEIATLHRNVRGWQADPAHGSIAQELLSWVAEDLERIAERAEQR